MVKKSFLSDQCKEVILGSILGDGSLKIHKPYKNARFSFRHSIKQEKYFLWKVSLLREICGNKFIWKQTAKNTFGGEKIRYQSRALEGLTEIYNLAHKRGKFKIRRKWLNMMSPLSLAIWWQDDGSIIGNGRKGVLCTDGFSYEDQKILSRYLLKVWGVKTSVGKYINRRRNNKEYFRIYIRSSNELKKFLRIILPYIKTLEMLYKVILLYKDDKLQQRWTSEVNKFTKFSQEVIQKLTREKKSKWKSFR